MKIKIISGGQTGVDRAALDAAIKSNITLGGWCPKGRKAEDGIIDSQYPLQETPSSNYRQRTEWNVRDSDGTLIITWGTPTGGTLLTTRLAQKLKKPLIIIDMNNQIKNEGQQTFTNNNGFIQGNKSAYVQIIDWIKYHNIQTLNIAGPRQPTNKNIYNQAYTFLLEFFKLHFSPP